MKLFSEYRGLRRELYFLCIGRMMTNMGSMIWPMFTLILNKKLGFNAGLIATCMMVFSIVALPISLLGGKLADRLNKRNIIIVCDLISAAAYVYCACVPISISSVIVFAAAALFQMVEWPSYDALVADFTISKDRERAYSLSYLGGNLGLVLSPTLGGLLFNHHLNLAFLISGLAIAASTLLIFTFIHDIHKEEDESDESVYETELEEGTSTLGYIKGNRVVLLYIGMAGLSQTIYNMFNYLMPLDLSNVHGENGSVLFGSMTSVNCLVVVAFTALITRWFRKLRDTDKIGVGQALILIGYVLFILWMKQPALCFVSMVVFTLGEIFCTLACNPFLTRRIPSSHRGRIMAVNNVVCGVVASVLQVGVGFIYDRSGSNTAWGSILAMGVIYLLLVIVLKRMDREEYPFLYQEKNE